MQQKCSIEQEENGSVVIPLENSDSSQLVRRWKSTSSRLHTPKKNQKICFFLKEKLFQPDSNMQVNTAFRFQSMKLEY